MDLRNNIAWSWQPTDVVAVSPEMAETAASGEVGMVASKHERRVYMWHLMPVSAPKDAPVMVTLDEVLDILRDAYTAGTAQMFLSADGRTVAPDAPAGSYDPKNRVYISDIVEDDKTITLLINRGDPTVADPAFIDVKSDDVKTISPGPDESQGWSAHLVIAKKKKAADQFYRACFERVPHANSWSAESLIRLILDRHADNNPKYTYPKHVKAKGKKPAYTESVGYRPAVTVHKVPSDQLKNDIKEGVISAITLIDSKTTYVGTDAPDIIQATKTKLVITPKKSVEQSRVLEFIEKIKPFAKKEGYTEIQIKLTDLPGGSSVSPTFLIEQGDAAETLYARSQRLDGFGVLLETCYAKVSPDISGKMIALINKSDKW